MKIKLILPLTIILIILLFLGCNNSYKVNNLSVNDFMPSKTNQKVIMSSKNFGNNKIIITEFIEGNKVQFRKLTSSTCLLEQWDLRNDGIYRSLLKEDYYDETNGLLNAESNINELILKKPIKEGTTWITENGMTHTITSINHRLKTKAGEFDTIEVTTISEDYKYKTYFAKDLGIVKTINLYADNIISQDEITSLSEDIYTSKEFRYYFYSKSTKKIVYVPQTFAMSTPENLTFLMIKKLKLPPETSYLPTISKDCKVTNIIPIYNKDTLAIDFSSEFINEMNLDSQTEKGIIQSLVNTLGYNFGVSNVRITINNKPYQSNNIVKKVEESFKVNLSIGENFFEQN